MLGREGWFTYDRCGNLLTEDFQVDSGTVMHCENQYDAKGRLISRKDGNGNVTEREYHTLFNGPSLVITPEGGRFYYSYDEAGRTMSMYDGEHTISYAYNNYNLRTIITHASGAVTRYDYDKMCNLVKEIQPEGYDEATFDGIGTRYTYDDMENLLTTTNPVGNTLALIRNLEGSITKEIHPNTYNPKLGDGEGIVNVYDEEERKIKMIYPDGGVVRFTYDADGHVIKRIGPKEYHQRLMMELDMFTAMMMQGA